MSLSTAPTLTDAEWTALGPALANNRPADFNTLEVIRLTIYRRAIHAGMYASREQDQTPTNIILNRKALQGYPS